MAFRGVRSSCDSVLTNSSFTRATRSASDRAARSSASSFDRSSSARRWSVMSWAVATSMLAPCAAAATRVMTTSHHRARSPLPTPRATKRASPVSRAARTASVETPGSSGHHWRQSPSTPSARAGSGICRRHDRLASVTTPSAESTKMQSTELSRIVRLKLSLWARLDAVTAASRSDSRRAMVSMVSSWRRRSSDWLSDQATPASSNATTMAAMPNPRAEPSARSACSARASVTARSDCLRLVASARRLSMASLPIFACIRRVAESRSPLSKSRSTFAISSNLALTSAATVVRSARLLSWVASSAASAMTTWSARSSAPRYDSRNSGSPVTR